MPSSGANIYQRARERAGFRQEPASELLILSVRQLQRIESGECVPSDDVVLRMEKLYQAPSLWYEHLMRSNQVAAAHLPSVDFGDIAQMTVQTMAMISDMQQSMSEMCHIAGDGKITPDEAPVWDEQIAATCQRMLSISIAIGVAAQKAKQEGGCK